MQQGRPNKKGRSPAALSVELPGIEPELLPGEMLSELQFQYVAVRFSPAHYMRKRIQVLTASRGRDLGHRPELENRCATRCATAPDAAPHPSWGGGPSHSSACRFAQSMVL
jgi:hypothetical protein